MKKIFFAILFFSACINSHSQKKWDDKIILTFNDTTHMYSRVKSVLTKWKFELQNNKEDTIISKPRSIYNPSGYAIVKAVISGKTVTLSGWYKDLRYGLKEMENTNKVNLKYYKTIVYFPNSSTWRLLQNVAEELKNNNFIYEEVKKNDIPSDSPRRSKEERLIELKNLFEKELITKEEYERAKKKILEEQ